MCIFSLNFQVYKLVVKIYIATHKRETHTSTMADQEGDNQIVIRPPQVKRQRRSRRHCQQLSEDLLHNIFSFLPIKHAIQTSVIAKSFEQSWLFCQKLDFGEEFARSKSRNSFMAILQRVFKLHQGPKIQSFQLYMKHMYIKLMVDHWVKISLSKEVEELELNFAQAFTPFTLPSNLLDSESLRILKLTNCHFHIPSQLKGWGFLNTIILKLVNVTEELIQELFKNCLFLETMGLTMCHGVTNLRIFAGHLKRFKWLRVENCPKMVKIHIDAPTLCTMYCYGDIKEFTLGNVSRLKEVTVKIGKGGFSPFVGIERFMFSLSHVQVLLIDVQSCNGEGLSPRLVDGNLEEVLPFCFWNLRELELSINGSFCGPFDVVTFLNKCPCLGFCWEEHDGKSLEELNISFKNLKFVRINGFNLERPVKKLVKFFLEKAEHLKTLILDTTTRSRIVAASSPTYDQIRRLKFLNQSYPGVRITVY